MKKIVGLVIAGVCAVLAFAGGHVLGLSGVELLALGEGGLIVAVI